ncbi:response regulator [Croceitalea sp. MTPC5]|uniref:response regulator n=1 Tax=Croceitalea sp. MTPC5 TaxID=3056565 RepID=UPI002B384F25|nr:response regulator [Croceitalea sp. MTPC5]
MLNKIILVDDNAATNFIHKKFLEKAKGSREVVSFQMGQNAIDYLSDCDNTIPELLFVDINMPTMDAWEFLEHFKTIERPEKDKAKIILLTTSLSPQDEIKITERTEVENVMTKPLDVASIQGVLKRYFPLLSR